MLRGFIAFILCAVLAFPWVSKVAITADFVIHQDYIAKNLCENRDKPEMECGGKCVLMQKLKLTENEQDEPQQLPQITQMECFSFVVNDFTFQPIESLQADSSENLPAPTNRVESMYTHDIFHPPRQA
ncbi:hypothetical protein [Owenweeksia hongkongensis]|uniref:Uncharacterized protein n=1 Tax=Owenweeksia hongkongensis (strain DSM 17368 / CIP 108786 / JCM 12287 / NRRL B-23963 / UST20020801) TaxID=926562 RepID=G8QZT1_OWEHD|nr:hypothetical protein [Owenweeksia hongkongensis]AEV31525.1 hypothetical protein Oweho_0509 [Owenweeksia hongkongensis DSM 17368]